MDDQFAGARREPRSAARSLLGWAISLLCIGLIAWRVDFAGAVEALRTFSWPMLFPAIVGLTAGYMVRVLRWQMMLRATGASVDFKSCLSPFLGSIALNNVLPLRIGDIVRGTVFPAAIGVPRTAAIGSIVMERLLDLLTLVIFLAIGAGAIHTVRLPSWLLDGAVILAIAGGIGVLCIFLFSGLIARLFHTQAGLRPEGDLVAKGMRIAAALLDGFRHMSAPRALGVIAVLSGLVWLGEATAFYFVIRGFGLTLPPVAALLVMAFITISTLVPSSPGYVGPFHLAAFSVLVLLGATDETATSFAVLSHLVLWVPTTLAGGLAMLVKPELFRAARSGRHDAIQETDT